MGDTEFEVGFHNREGFNRLDVKKPFLGIRMIRTKAKRQDHGGHDEKKGRAWNTKSI